MTSTFMTIQWLHSICFLMDMGQNDGTYFVPYVNHALRDSFAKIDQRKVSIAAHGWIPLNYALLDHTSLKTSAL